MAKNMKVQNFNGPAAEDILKTESGAIRQTSILKAAAGKENATSNAIDYETDLFAAFNTTTKELIIAPPFDPRALRSLVYRNDALRQCIEAMEVNVELTGYDIVDAVGAVNDTPEAQDLKGFFDEPYPGESFLLQRRALRRDMEEVGYAFLEVIANVENTPVLLRVLKPEVTFLLKLDNATQATRTVYRNGKEVSVTMVVRERRFVQSIGSKTVYFKEFGATRDLHKDTGQWHPAGSLTLTERANEVLYFPGNYDPQSPYGIPRWIPQLPSVIGSRSAEELNLEYFRSGGIPPVLVFLLGGTMNQTTKQTLEGKLSGAANQKLRAMVCEIESDGLSMDDKNHIAVQVERFASEQQKDSLFDQYDAKCEMRVRSAFRLPPIFIGNTESYSYATAFASYTVAEAQVFGPERLEFDTIINTSLVRRLGYAHLRFKSKPLMVSDSVIQLQGMGMVKDVVDGESFVESLNSVTSLSLKYKEPEPPPAPIIQQAPGGQPPGAVNDIANPEDQEGKVIQKKKEPKPPEGTNYGYARKSDEGSLQWLGFIQEVANDYATMLNLRDGAPLSPEAETKVLNIVQALSKEDRNRLDLMMAYHGFGSIADQSQDLSVLANHVCSVVSHGH